MIHTVKKKKISGNLRGVIYLPKTTIGKRFFVIPSNELTKYNRSYWFLMNLKKQLNKMRNLK